MGTKMKVLLVQDVVKLGSAGDIKEVSGGYGRNYLLPQGLAVLATRGQIKQAEERAAAQRKRDFALRKDAEALGAKFAGQTLRFTAKVGEQDRLYGSVTSGDIAERLASLVGAEVDRRKILLDEPIKLQVADVNVAVLVIFAIASMSVYGIVLAGWSSNSKYSLLGGLRSSAQMISYELSYGMALASVLVMANSMSLTDVVNAQAGAWFGVIPKWFVFIQPLGFLIYMTAGIAETNRAPFDFPEAEQELVAGYHTEYSSMSFALFFLAEYINMVTVSAVATDLFLGGWHGPLLPESLGWIWFLIKVGALLFFYVWMRWTLPRYRYDQLMTFGWKVLLPLSVVNLLATSAGVLYFGL